LILILFLRSLLFSLYFYISVIVFTLFFVVLSPFIGLKKRYGLTSRYISTLLIVLKYLCRIDWKVKGDILSKKPVIIASNHQGLWESFYLQTLANPLTTIIKKELVYIPFFGLALYLLSPIRINRSKKIQSAKRVMVCGTQKLRSGFSILLFPEGTRKIPGKKIGKFARSAADLAIKNNIDLIPIYHDSGLYWKNKKFIKFPGTVKVIIGAPIKGKNSSEMTKNLVDWMNKKASMGTK
tara:strand:+ start:138 stop:851 length:714 start_codon:yes stop_codon:yes gene_type:complete